MKVKGSDSLKTLIPTLIKVVVTVVVVILYIHYFLPQNWAYFTTKPSQTFYNAYRVDNGLIQNRPLILNNMSFGMGVSRKGRVYYKDLIELLNDNKHIPWKPFQEDSISSISQNANYDTVYIDNPKSFFTGKLLIVSAERPSDIMILKGKSSPVVKNYILAVTKVK